MGEACLKSRSGWCRVRLPKETPRDWPRRDSNPHGDCSPQDFKSGASACFATRPLPLSTPTRRSAREFRTALRCIDTTSVRPLRIPPQGVAPAEIRSPRRAAGLTAPASASPAARPSPFRRELPLPATSAAPNGSPIIAPASTGGHVESMFTSYHVAGTTGYHQCSVLRCRNTRSTRIAPTGRLPVLIRA